MIYFSNSSFTNQVIAQLELWNNKGTVKYKNNVYVLSRNLDEKVTALHLGRLGAKLTKDRSDYLNIPIEASHFQVSRLSNCSFTNQVIAQLELWNNKGTVKYKNNVYVLSRNLDEKVTALHLGRLGAKLTKDRSDYLNIPIEGPNKPTTYSY
ncbi:S-adenosyl-L-homocysteine hydrolase [Artemisia annua]|uniref:S-adenosyl-L-homocysteine hydrolase n=1 Tax=Artemisia annua TaxID=35608 RepID=A0A2U1P226_ARTAN|nr:S-adenosyl-L-homocysteine hydrolase [Artemisia annua]